MRTALGKDFGNYTRLLFILTDLCYHRWFTHRRTRQSHGTNRLLKVKGSLRVPLGEARTSIVSHNLQSRRSRMALLQKVLTNPFPRFITRYGHLDDAFRLFSSLRE